MNSYNFLKSLHCPKFLIAIIASFIFIISLILFYFITVYDSYLTYAVYDNSFLKVDVLVDYSEYFETNLIKIDNKMYEFEIIKISELYEQNGANYQEYYLKVNNLDINFLENEIVKVTFYYNKEKIIQKIIKLIF